MKRGTLCILLCLILLTGGAITTVAVAWGCAFAFWVVTGDSPTPSKEYGNYRLGDDYLTIVRYSFTGCTYIIGVCSEDGIRSTGQYVPEILRAELDIEHARERDTVGLAFDWWENIAAGWPMVALWMEYEESPNGAGPLTDRWALRLPMSKRHGPSSLRKPTIPLRPLWPGFGIDTLFYGAIWFGVFFAPGSAKRFIRAKRGRCPRCGYDLRGQLAAGCPECGWGR